MTHLQRILAFAAVFALTILTSSSVWAITSTFVQNQFQWNNANSWANGDQPTVPTTGGGSIPNGVGDKAIFQHPVTSGGNNVQVQLGASNTVTVGEILVRHGTEESQIAIAQGNFIFDNGGPTATATVTETLGTGNDNTSRLRIVTPVTLNSNLLINQHHNLRRNSATEFVGLMSTTAAAESAGITITKEGDGNVQFAYGGSVANPTDGFQGILNINNGAVRLINGVGTTNTVFSKAKGINVADKAQFQLGNNITSFSIGESSPGVKAEIAIKGLGNDNPNGINFPPEDEENYFGFNAGALRFEQEAGNRSVCDFNSPIRLQPVSPELPQVRIFVTAPGTTANLNEEVRGDDLAGLNKGGDGLLKLTTSSANGNTYAGNTNVSDGYLAVNNTVSTASGIGTGNMFVNNGGLVGGTGTIGMAADPSNLSVSEGTLAPGDLSIDSISAALIQHAGTLTVHGNVSFTSASLFNLNIGSTYDQLVASGSITLGNATLNLDLGSFVPNGTDSYTLISNTGAGALNGVFGTVNVNGVAATGEELDLNGAAYQLSYAGGVGGNDLMLVPVSDALLGDHNGDGVVDILDYVVWRAHPDSSGGDPDGYEDWAENYGNPPDSGSGNAFGAAVPEPSTGVVIVLAAVLGLACGRVR